MFNAVLQACLGAEMRWSVLNEDGSPGFALLANGKKVSRSPWRRNLITDTGLDQLAAYDFSLATAGLRNYLGVGTGSTETKDKSGAITASQAGTTVTASAAFFAATDVGDIIRWPGGEHARIVTFTSATSVEVGLSQAVAAAAFEIWRVSRSQLATEVLRGNDVGGFAASFIYSVSGSQLLAELTLTRVITLDINRTLTEWGLTPTNDSSNYGFIDLIRDGAGNPQALSILAGKKFAVEHKLTITLPYVNESKNLDIEEYDASNALVGTTAYTADTTIYAASDYLSAFRVFNPATAALRVCRLNSGESNLPSAGITVTSPIKLATNTAYVPGSRSRKRSASFLEGEVNTAHYGWSLYHATVNNVSNDLAGFKILFTSPATFTKVSTHTLQVGIESTWDRSYL